MKTTINGRQCVFGLTQPRHNILWSRYRKTNRHAEAVAVARERFGQAFCHEPGSTWRPNPVPFLTRWLQAKGAA